MKTKTEIKERTLQEQLVTIIAILEGLGPDDIKYLLKVCKSVSQDYSINMTTRFIYKHVASLLRKLNK